MVPYNQGTVFVFDVAGSGGVSVLYSFKGGNEAHSPFAGLTNLNDTFYGTTAYGGTYNKGTVFSITPGGTETVLHSFGGGSDGSQPYAALTVLNGQLYGTTAYGGTGAAPDARRAKKPSSEGTIFTITPSGSESVVHDFTGGPGGRVRTQISRQ